ncbi:unnamed protein product [Merluccius merluccius]
MVSCHAQGHTATVSYEEPGIEPATFRVAGRPALPPGPCPWWVFCCAMSGRQGCCGLGQIIHHSAGRQGGDLAGLALSGLLALL